MRMSRFGQGVPDFLGAHCPSLYHHDAGHGSCGTAGAQSESSRINIFGFPLALLMGKGGRILPCFGGIIVVTTFIQYKYIRTGIA
jgi:hypothetical protein